MTGRWAVTPARVAVGYLPPRPVPHAAVSPGHGESTADVGNGGLSAGLRGGCTALDGIAVKREGRDASMMHVSS